jgi:DNA-binding NarL/FixJ family response regulator
MSSPSVLRMLIVEDQEIFHETLSNFIQRDFPEATFRFATNGREALNLMAAELPDLVILDFQMKVLNGYDTTIEALALYPSIKIIILSSFANQRNAIDFFKAGALGFLDKLHCSSHLQICMQTVLQGGYYLYLIGEVDEHLVKRMCHLHKSLEPLTAREKEVLILICEQKTDKEIAKLLQLSDRTVQKHHATILQKTNCLNSAGLARYAIMHGISD